MVDGDMVLRPYSAERDASDLFRVLDDPPVWQHIPGGAPDSAAALATRFARRLADGLRSTWIIEVAGAVAGTSSFVFDPADDAGVEIGSTYLSPPLWGSGANRRAKRLMVSAAFDGGAAWVQFRTDERNLRSAAAILSLDAVELPAREDRWIRADGTRRVSRYFRLSSPI
ncbi:GNAT family N-acetyltransferase [Micromonospora sp. NPDC047620]|uniref:GNAT family N-acetyltransferase n=1 Tax=Micromonospora sp. NPDC047620 TaxID=3364251 RepID=UPI003713ED0C